MARPLVLKQLVAVIDGRTSVVCLHAAGQVKPADEPFDTLLGPQQSPPFHIHCRSIVVPYIRGMTSEYRRAANEELQRRPPSQRKYADGRIASKIPLAPAPVAPGVAESTATIGADQAALPEVLDAADQRLLRRYAMGENVEIPERIVRVVEAHELPQPVTVWIQARPAVLDDLIDTERVDLGTDLIVAPADRPRARHVLELIVSTGLALPLAWIGAAVVTSPNLDWQFVGASQDTEGRVATIQQVPPPPPPS